METRNDTAQSNSVMDVGTTGQDSHVVRFTCRVVARSQVSGRITYNGHGMDEFVPRRNSAYVSQDDLHIGEMTVRETLYLSLEKDRSGVNRQGSSVEGVEEEGDDLPDSPKSSEFEGAILVWMKIAPQQLDIEIDKRVLKKKSTDQSTRSIRTFTEKSSASPQLSAERTTRLASSAMTPQKDEESPYQVKAKTCYKPLEDSVMGYIWKRDDSKIQGEVKSTTMAKQVKERKSKMIKEALLALKEKGGSSPYAIAKYMEEKHKAVLPANFNKMLKVSKPDVKPREPVKKKAVSKAKASFAVLEKKVVKKQPVKKTERRR
ncbi:hypothetical protein IFM89_012284 [Coptis chinensis]|uniref:H15 domain-containing protein n=1 Tax=Coptis chinensis TaxID=261450 RepID=A0A835HEA3_9MAGN|nr:hypothetical protein IFM89_012284 [Coptis chinensis]